MEKHRETGHIPTIWQQVEKYHVQKSIGNERRISEEQLQQAIRNIEGEQRNHNHGFLPPERQIEQWTVDRFWGVDRPQQPKQEDQSGHSTRNEQSYQKCIPLEEGEIGSDTDQHPSNLEVPAVNWAKHVGVKSVHYIKMVHAPKVDAEETNHWDLGNAVRETKKNFSTDLHLLMIETTNDPKILKTLVCLECWQYTRTRPKGSYCTKRSYPQANVLQRPSHSAQKAENNGHRPPSQRTAGDKQDVYGSETFLVTQNYRSHSEEIGRLRPVPNV